MKIDFNKVLVDLDQKPIMQSAIDENGKIVLTNKELTLAIAATVALLGDYPDERLSGQEKAQRYALATKIHGSNGLPLDMDLDDVKIIRDLVAKAYQGALVPGQVWFMFNGDEK
jgi:hypothetical protein